MAHTVQTPEYSSMSFTQRSDDEFDLWVLLRATQKVIPQPSSIISNSPRSAMIQAADRRSDRFKQMDVLNPLLLIRIRIVVHNHLPQRRQEMSITRLRQSLRQDLCRRNVSSDHAYEIVNVYSEFDV